MFEHTKKYIEFLEQHFVFLTVTRHQFLQLGNLQEYKYRIKMNIEYSILHNALTPSSYYFKWQVIGAAIMQIKDINFEYLVTLHFSTFIVGLGLDFL